MSQERISEIRTLLSLIEAVDEVIKLLQLSTLENPAPGKLDELIIEQRRTNELLEAPLSLSRETTRTGVMVTTAT